MINEKDLPPDTSPTFNDQEVKDIKRLMKMSTDIEAATAAGGYDEKDFEYVAMALHEAESLILANPEAKRYLEQVVNICLNKMHKEYKIWVKVNNLFISALARHGLLT